MRPVTYLSGFGVNQELETPFCPFGKKHSLQFVHVICFSRATASRWGDELKLYVDSLASTPPDKPRETLFSDLHRQVTIWTLHKGGIPRAKITLNFFPSDS